MERPVAAVFRGHQAPGGYPAALAAAGPHFFFDPADRAGDRVTLTGEQARHLAVVLRARQGDPATLADNTGAVFRARVGAVSSERVTLTVAHREDVPAPRPRLTVVHALPKGRKLDEVVAKLSEVGVDRLVPVPSSRGQVRLSGARADKAVARWRAVALAAGKQSRRARLLEVTDICDWHDALDGDFPGVVLWEEAPIGLRAVLATLPEDPGDVVLAVGPEGGLTRDEAAAGGLPAASLGPTVLRTETAALVAASITLASFGRLG